MPALDQQLADLVVVVSLDRLAVVSVVGLDGPVDQLTPGQPTRGQDTASGFKGSETFAVMGGTETISD